MKARDVMTTKVVAVSPDTPTNKIAALLLDNRISAVPVVDGTGAPIGMVSEETDISEIARLLAAYRIKRVPVVRDGRVIGIVSRADLLRGLAQGEPKPAGARRARASSIRAARQAIPASPPLGE